MLTPFWLKIIGIGAAAMMLLVLAMDRNHWRSEAKVARLQVAMACAATIEASANPKLACKDMPQQIRLLGQAVLDLKLAIIDQNDAVRRLADASAKARQEAEKAVSAAKERVKAAQGQSDRLARSAGDPARGKRPCEPSDALKGAWR